MMSDKEVCETVESLIGAAEDKMHKLRMLASLAKAMLRLGTCKEVHALRVTYMDYAEVRREENIELLKRSAFSVKWKKAMTELAGPIRELALLLGQIVRKELRDVYTDGASAADHREGTSESGGEHSGTGQAAREGDPSCF